MHALRQPVSILATVLFVSVASPAFAIEPGMYACEVTTAFGVTLDGSTQPLDDTPTEFRLEAANAPVTGSELRRGGPHRTTEFYDAEPARIIAASIDTPLFRSPLTSLRSADGRIYTQLGNTLRIEPDGAFVAFGLASKDVLDGIAVYTGKCSSLGQ